MPDLTLLATAGEVAAWGANDQESVIRDRHELSRVQFWARVNALIDTPTALEHDPATTRRLQRLRDSRMVGVRR